jgi:hypothetical protein
VEIMAVPVGRIRHIDCSLTGARALGFTPRIAAVMLAAAVFAHAGRALAGSSDASAASLKSQIEEPAPPDEDDDDDEGLTTVPPLGAGCALDDGPGCLAPRTTHWSMTVGLDFDELNGLPLKCTDCAAVSTALTKSGSTTVSTAGPTLIEPRLHGVNPFLDVDGDIFGARLPVPTQYWSLHAFVLALPIEVHLQHRWGWLQPSLGLDSAYFFGNGSSDNRADYSIRQGAFAVRAAVRAYLTPNITVGAFSERGLSGLHYEAVGFSIGGHIDF